MNVYEELDENYVIYTELEMGRERARERERGNRFRVKLFCVNPAANLKRYLDQGRSTVFFSATLLPISYYKKLLSVEPDDYAIYAKSPFDEEKRLLVVGTDVSTRYTLRGSRMYEKYADYILQILGAKAGNYLVFFPSYRFLQDVLAAFEKRCPDDVRCIVQEQNMHEQEKEAFLQLFRERREGSLAGFCVLGGIFSEGIDLTEESLIGAIVVGTGLPQVCSEREILKQYFEKKGENGFDYAYLYPGMNKVQQAAGRVIRTENDRGVIALLDERFAGQKYRALFPREWTNVRTTGDARRAGEEIRGFWD